MTRCNALGMLDTSQWHFGAYLLQIHQALLWLVACILHDPFKEQNADHRPASCMEESPQGQRFTGRPASAVAVHIEM